MPRTVEDLLRSGATEVKVGTRRKDRPIAPSKVHRARLNYWNWAKQRDNTSRELLDPILSGIPPPYVTPLEKPHTGRLAMVITPQDKGLFLLQELFK